MEAISFRKANDADMELYFNWTNDVLVREQSFNSEAVSFTDHKDWFLAKLKDSECLMLLFENSRGDSVGQVRIQNIDSKNAVLGFSIGGEFRGRGYGIHLIRLSVIEFFKHNKGKALHAYVKIENIPSKKTFERAGFKLEEETVHNNCKSFHFIKNADRKF